ncbi:MAG: SPOR domain-containing protein [Novosphingobium sp.]
MINGEGEDPKELPEHEGENLMGDGEPVGEPHGEGHGLLAGDDAAEPARLDFNEEDRLPWLETADDDYDEAGMDGARVFGFVLAGLAVLAALIGTIWWVTHRTPDAALVADGSTIAAPAEPYKEAPTQPGGKTFAGTGDSSFAVSAGQTRPAHLAGASETPKPSVDTGAKPAAAASAAAPAASAGGVGVQVGAYSTKAQAEAGWTRLSSQNAMLKGVSHRIVEGTADVGTVFRLQAVAADGAGADALCGNLKSAGIACQVKR